MRNEWLVDYSVDKQVFQTLRKFDFVVVGGEFYFFEVLGVVAFVSARQACEIDFFLWGFHF